MSRRTDQLASILHKAAQGVIQEGLADPRAEGMATITKVVVADDLSQANFHVSIFPEKNESKYMHALEEAANHIRREVSGRIAMHHPPKFVFKLDRSLKKEAAVLGTLSELARERPADASPVPESPPKEDIP